jgi:hypothetical protein
MKKGRRSAQTSHSNSTHFIAPDLYSAPSPRSDDRRDGSVASRSEVFFTSSVRQSQHSRGTPESPLAGKLALNAR